MSLIKDPRLHIPADINQASRLQEVASSYAPLLANADYKSRQVSELVHGQRAEVFDRDGVFFRVRVKPLIQGSTRPGYVGWVDSTHLTDVGALPAFAVSVLTAPLFSEPDLKSPIIMSVPAGSQLSLARVENGYRQTATGLWISQRHIRSLSAPETDFVTAGRLYRGQPYIWGGTGGRGVDCSGLVQMACAACGLDAPRDADMQEASLGQPVDKPERAGDLLFWRGHVGILSDEDTLLHANAFHMGVVEEPLKTALERFEGNDLPLRTIRRLSA